MQGTSSLLHDPMRVSTPSMRLANAARIERQNRIALAAFRYSPPTKPSAPPIPDAMIEFAHTVIDDVTAPDGAALSPFLTDRIQRAVLQFYPNQTRADMFSVRRKKDIVLARQTAMYLCKKLTPSSYPAIGRIFGNRDHSTVIHAVNTIEEKRAKDPELNERIEQIIAKLSDAA